jgi:hypothetical protein
MLNGTFSTKTKPIFSAHFTISHLEFHHQLLASSLHSLETPTPLLDEAWSTC